MGNRIAQVPKIYLAGGMRGDWQDRVKESVAAALPGQPVLYLDPRQQPKPHPEQSPEQVEASYTNWDLTGVQVADIVFGYIEASNPGGHGLALEIGYAVGMAHAGAAPKHIILVVEDGYAANRYLGMARVCADMNYTSLDKGIDGLVRHLKATW